MEPISETRKEKIKECMKAILKAGSEDKFHLNNVTRQIDTLALVVGDLLKNNENGVNDSLIGYYYHVGKSLRELEKVQKSNQDE